MSEADAPLGTRLAVLLAALRGLRPAFGKTSGSSS